jgi:hypothetical protein
MLNYLVRVKWTYLLQPTKHIRNLQIIEIVNLCITIFLGQYIGNNVVVEKVNSITTIGLNRPEKRNCVDLATARELENAFKTFENDSSSPVAVLYGKGGTFCAGLDLKEVSEFPKDFDFIASKNYDPMNDDGIGPMVR